MRTRFLALVTIPVPVMAKRTLRFSLPISPSFSSPLLASHRHGTGYGRNFYTRWKSSARMCKCVHECRTEVGRASQYLRIIPRCAYHVRADEKENVYALSEYVCTTNCNTDAEINTYTRIYLYICQYKYW